MLFVFLTPGYHPDIDGGAYRYAAEVARVLADRGHEVHAITKSPNSQAPAREERHGVVIHRLGYRSAGWIANWRGGNREAGRKLEELLHKSPGRALILSHHAYFEPAIRSRNFVSFCHGPWGLEHRFACQARRRPWPRRFLDLVAAHTMARIESRALRASRRIFVASQYIAGQLPRWHPQVRSTIEVVGGGADHERFRPRGDRRVLRQRKDLDDDALVLLAVRRLDARMGLRGLIEAFGDVFSRFPRLQLWLAGRGELSTELERFAAQHQFGRRFRLLGFVPEDDLPELYAAVDVVVMPSLDLEGFGLVTAESMASGTPVLASRAGANAEVVGPLDQRLLFDAGSRKALVSILAAVADGTLPLPSREQVAAFARQQFRWERPADAFERAHPDFQKDVSRS